MHVDRQWIERVKEEAEVEGVPIMAVIASTVLFDNTLRDGNVAHYGGCGVSSHGRLVRRIIKSLIQAFRLKNSSISSKEDLSSTSENVAFQSSLQP